MPRPRTLLLVLLAALLTVLAGPSAAASAATSAVPGSCATSVTGIAPNGDHATMRAGHPIPPLPAAVPAATGVLIAPPAATAFWRISLLPHPGSGNPVPLSRGPPAG